MNKFAWLNIKKSLFSANQWFQTTPDRAVELAYDAALQIRKLEIEKFDGQPVNSIYTDYGPSVRAYFDTELKKYLNIIQTRMIEFNASNLMLEATNKLPESSPESAALNQSDEVLEKLTFIDGVIARYNEYKSSRISQSLMPVNIRGEGNRSLAQAFFSVSPESNISESLANELNLEEPETEFLPRSLLGELNRIKKDLDPKSETEMVKIHRRSRIKTIISIRLLLLLILIPLLVQQFSKNTFVGAIVDNFYSPTQGVIFINPDLEKEGLEELKMFEEQLEFKILIDKAPEINKEEKNKLLQEKAEEIATEYRRKSADAYKNILADLCSLIAFVTVLFFNKKDVDVFKSFIDNVTYNLSDSAKAFIIILLTDIFVGFHSPHGWEVLLEGIARHLGIAENRSFNFLFIATFPVILDTVFKYWIFRYLNRSSPSAVATYRNMNE